MGMALDLVQNLRAKTPDSWEPRAAKQHFFDAAGNLYTGEKLEEPSIGWTYGNFVNHFSTPVGKVPGGGEFLDLMHFDALIMGEDLQLAALFLAELPLDRLRAVAEDPDETIERWEEINRFFQLAVKLPSGAVYES